MDKSVIFQRTIPRTLDTLVRQADGTLQAWLFEDRESRRAAESQLATRGIGARIRSAYKPLLHFFLEEAELSGLTGVRIETPNHPLAAPHRFRMEAYPLAGLLRGVPIVFAEGRKALHHVVTLEYGARTVVHEVFAPNRERRTPFGDPALAPCGWVGDAETGHAVETDYELAFLDIMTALKERAWPPPPHFDVLWMSVRTGGIEQPLPYGDECISTREALHEDLYFSALEYFQFLNGRVAGDRTLQPGHIVPDIRRGTGPTELVLEIRSGIELHFAIDDSPRALEDAQSPLTPDRIAEEVDRLGGTRFDGSSKRGAAVLATAVDGKDLGLVLSAGQHANETSGVVGVLRAAASLKARGVKFALFPQENPDGYALHRTLRLHNPRHMHHAARFSALGDDIAYRDVEPLRERAVRLEAFRRGNVRLHVNLHGYPAHEWTRPHTGYVPRDSFLWMVPRGFFLIMRYHPGFQETGERFVHELAGRVSETPGLREFNEAHLKTFEAHVGSLPFKIHRGVPYVATATNEYVPRFTVIGEYPDETIYGDAFRLAHTVGMRTVLEATRMLEEGLLNQDN